MMIVLLQESATEVVSGRLYASLMRRQWVVRHLVTARRRVRLVTANVPARVVSFYRQTRRGASCSGKITAADASPPLTFRFSRTWVDRVGSSWTQTCTNLGILQPQRKRRLFLLCQKISLSTECCIYNIIFILFFISYC